MGNSMTARSGKRFALWVFRHSGLACLVLAVLWLATVAAVALVTGKSAGTAFLWVLAFTPPAIIVSVFLSNSETGYTFGGRLLGLLSLVAIWAVMYYLGFDLGFNGPPGCC